MTAEADSEMVFTSFGSSKRSSPAKPVVPTPEQEQFARLGPVTAK